jgi:hypothetical protein
MAETEELNDEVKHFIVQGLACFQTPSEVAAAVKDEYGLTVSRQRVHAYDPTKKAGSALCEELRLLFEATRVALIEGKAQSAIEHRAVRLRWLNDMAIAARARGNIVLAASLIEQAAKESGGAFTNRRELTGKDGGPVQSVVMTGDEFEAIARKVADEV